MTLRHIIGSVPPGKSSKEQASFGSITLFKAEEGGKEKDVVDLAE